MTFTGVILGSDHFANLSELFLAGSELYVKGIGLYGNLLGQASCQFPSDSKSLRQFSSKRVL